jgi:DNA-binding SARP family transcriptional activator
MLRLSTIGSVAIHIDNVPVPPANQQVFSALFYLTVERGTPTPRRLLAEMFFPDAAGDAGNHSLRQLIYRLRKLGVRVDADQLVVSLPAAEATWDVEDLLSRGSASAEVLDSLRRGYLDDYAPRHSDRFTRWLEEHRVLVSTKLRHLLIEQMNGERSQKRYRSLDGIARAVLALDPLNEEATLAAAESMAMSGAKAQALAFLDAYLDEIGTRSAELRVNPRILRERISRYVPNPDATEQLPLVGRDKELATLIDVIDQASAGSPQVCIVTGPSGIGKSRLLIEACSMAALAGKRVIRVRLQAHDTRRAFAVLRDLGPGLLDLPGAIGASPEALAAVKGLCGRGPSTYQSIPTGALEAEALVSEVKSRVVEVADAVAGEQPVVVCIEDAHWIDEASLELIADLVSAPRPLSIILASQRPIRLPSAAHASLGQTFISLAALTHEHSLALIGSLFVHAKRSPDPAFIASAANLAGGVPFYLHVLFRSYVETGDPTAQPESLSDFLAQRLGDLPEPARSVYDAIVILGSHCSEARLESLTELPRYELLRSLRVLEADGFLRAIGGQLSPSHELFGATAVRQMPLSVARLLHRNVALMLETDGTSAEPLAVAMHWEACGEHTRARTTLCLAANNAVRLGRAGDAIALLTHAERLTSDPQELKRIRLLLIEACHTAGEYIRAIDIAESLGGVSAVAHPALALSLIEMLEPSGRSAISFRDTLVTISTDRNLTENLRCRAVKQLIIIAEHLNDPSLAEEALVNLEGMSPDSLDPLLPRLIYETVFGLRSKAASLAIQACALALQASAPSRRLEGLSVGILALWRNGALSDATAFAEEAYAVALKAKVVSACTWISSLVAHMHWYADNAAATRLWLERTRQHIEKCAFPDKGLQYYSVAILVALEEGQVEAARGLLKTAEQLFPLVYFGRLDLERLAFRVRIDLAAGKLPELDDVQRLLSGHLARRNTGLQDVVADTLVAALDRRGRKAEAAEIRDAYLRSYRKDGYPVPRCLGHLKSGRTAPAISR